MWSGPSQYALSARERRRDKAKRSPAYQIISLFHAYEGYQQGKSNIRTDHAHQAIMNGCIRFGIRFDLDDFAVINGAGEAQYSLACGDERGIANPSAAHALEKHFERKPFLIEDDGNCTPTRIYVGRRFKWKGKDVTCTSFAKDQESFTACSYKLRDGDKWRNRDVEKRFRIAHADIITERKEAKERAAHMSALTASCKDQPGRAAEILAYLGNPSKEDFGLTPIHKLRSAMEKFAPNVKDAE